MTEEEFQNRLSSALSGKLLGPFEIAIFDLFRSGTTEQRAKLWEMYRPMDPSRQLTPERRLSRALRSSLARVADVGNFLIASERRERLGILDGLEHFLAASLSVAYPQWQNESIDGFYFVDARKTDAIEAELFGVCILISDQSVTPIHIRLKLHSSEDKIDWMHCRLGQRGTGPGNMERIPCASWRDDPFVGLPISSDLVDWVYEVTLTAGRQMGCVEMADVLPWT